MARKPRNAGGKEHQARSVHNGNTSIEAEPGRQQTAPTVPRDSASIFSLIREVKAQRACLLVLLAALYSPVSQHNLAPVYGAVPAGLYHYRGSAVAAFLAIAFRRFLPGGIGGRAISSFCFWIPTIQFLMFQSSSILGNPLGPVVTEMLTYYPLVILSLSTAVQFCDDLKHRAFDSRGDTLNQSNSLLVELGPPISIMTLFSVLQQATRSFMSRYIGGNFLTSRIGMQLTIATLYGLALPSSVLWPSLPSVAFTMLGNPHTPLWRTTQVLNNTLALYDYTLLERRESVTGYISVLEDNQKQFRAMRCDHSLLGGQWIMAPRHGGRDRRVAEPIYAIFAMLEAVRLVEASDGDRENKKALTIGLGIGTAPSALIAHGVSTTIIELDPVVHEFALKYFALPYNHTSYIGDAFAAVLNTSRMQASTYDYIIHDVFTGGVEPVDLFTVDFLSGLHLLLKPRGTIAINYAGDLSMPAASLVYRTILSVFPSCRAFRENEAPEAGSQGADFTNMVFFCRKEPGPIKFRRPVEADFLGSGARREYLLPKYEISPDSFERHGSVLKKGQTRELRRWQTKSAIGHWKLMRTVLPDGVWENW